MIPPSPMPQRGEFPTVDAYLRAWYLWRAVERDKRLNPAEAAARYATQLRWWHRTTADPAARQAVAYELARIGDRLQPNT